MQMKDIIECRTCTVQTIIDGEPDAAVALCTLADGDAVAQHKADNPTHVITVNQTYWGS